MLRHQCRKRQHAVVYFPSPSCAAFASRIYHFEHTFLTLISALHLPAYLPALPCPALAKGQVQLRGMASARGAGHAA